MWHPEIQDRPRPILGRVNLCPPAEPARYEEWSSQSGCEAETDQLRNKVNRSQSLCDSTSKISFLIPPDPRRFSLASNESAVSSASSLCDIWAAPTSDDFRSSWYLDRRRSEGFVSDFAGSPSRGEMLREESPQVKTGMENVPQWLKQLRLHKYTELMMNLTYQELTSLQDEKLQKMNVTKGARRKIILSIEKLSERPKALASLCSKLDTEGCDIKEILTELEIIIKSPILLAETETSSSAQDSGAEVSDDEEISRIGPSKEDQEGGAQLVELIIKTMKKTASVILLSQHTEYKHVSMLIHLIDLCISQSSYSQSHKELLHTWKLKIQALWGPLGVALSKESQKLKFVSAWHPPSVASPAWPSSPQPPYQTFPNFVPRSSVPNIYTATPHYRQDYLKKRHSFQEGVQYFQEKFPDLSLDSDRSQPQSWARRHRGLDWRPAESENLFSRGVSDGLKILVTCEGEDTADQAEDDQLDVGLESLCLAVTEQALD